jgi:ankyrin repeat protein
MMKAFGEGTKVKNTSGKNLSIHRAIQEEDFDTALLLLKEYPEGAKVQDEEGCLPLYYACIEHATDVVFKLLDVYPEGAKVLNNAGKLPIHIPFSSEVTAALLKVYPDGSKVQDGQGGLPLHYAARKWKCCPNILRMLLNEYPEGIKVQTQKGNLPIHCAVQDSRDNAIIPMMLLKEYPLGARVLNNDGELPIHIECDYELYDFNIDLLDSLIKAYPESRYVRDKLGRLPSSIFAWSMYSCFEHFDGEEEDCDMYLCVIHDAINSGVSKICLSFILQAFPEGCMKQDKNRMIPLHHACASREPNFHQYITALLDVHSGEFVEPDFYDKQFSVQDDQGRTPFQLLPANDLLLLHDLLANSTYLSEKSVRLLVNMFPKSIATPNKYGMLPFHCACLNPVASIEILMLFISFSPEVLAPIQPHFNFSAEESCGKRKRP